MIYKICMLGSTNVGKTQVIHNLKNSSKFYIPCITLGVDFSQIDFNEHTMQILDYSGCRQFKNLITIKKEFCDLACIVCNLKQLNSIKELKKYYAVINDTRVMKHVLINIENDNINNISFRDELEKYISIELNLEYSYINSYCPKNIQRVFKKIIKNLT